MIEFFVFFITAEIIASDGVQARYHREIFFGFFAAVIEGDYKRDTSVWRCI